MRKVPHLLDLNSPTRVDCFPYACNRLYGKCVECQIRHRKCTPVGPSSLLRAQKDIGLCAKQSQLPLTLLPKYDHVVQLILNKKPEFEAARKVFAAEVDTHSQQRSETILRLEGIEEKINALAGTHSAVEVVIRQRQMELRLLEMQEQIAGLLSQAWRVEHKVDDFADGLERRKEIVAQNAHAAEETVDDGELATQTSAIANATTPAGDRDRAMEFGMLGMQKQLQILIDLAVQNGNKLDDLAAEVAAKHDAAVSTKLVPAVSQAPPGALEMSIGTSTPPGHAVHSLNNSTHPMVMKCQRRDSDDETSDDDKTCNDIAATLNHTEYTIPLEPTELDVVTAALDGFHITPKGRAWAYESREI